MRIRADIADQAITASRKINRKLTVPAGRIATTGLIETRMHRNSGMPPLVGSAKSARTERYDLSPQHFLYFLPLPHGQGSFRFGPPDSLRIVSTGGGSGASSSPGRLF